MALRLRQASDSSGDLRQDLKQIAIDRIGQDEYDNLDTISKQKISEFTNEQAIATQAFLQRQELNITDMEAYGVIEPGKIRTLPSIVTGGTAPGGGPLLPGTTAASTQNSNRIKFRVQISDRSNKVGIPEVGRMVKRTLVKFIRIFF